MTEPIRENETRKRGPKENFQRNAEIAALVSSGTTTLEQIGQAYGVSRERVRQIAVSRGVMVRTCNSADPVAVLRAIRSTRATSWHQAAVGANTSSVIVRETIAALGLTVAVHRLFRWRIGSAKRAEIRRMVHLYRAEVARVGRPLTATEIVYLRPSPQYVLGQNYVTKLRRLAGEPPHNQGGGYRNGVRRGDVKQAIFKLAASRDGVTIPRVMKRVPTTLATVRTTVNLLCRNGALVCVDKRRGSAGFSTYRLASSVNANSSVRSPSPGGDE